MVVTRGGEVREVGRCWLKGTKLQLSRISKSIYLMYNMITIVNNTALNIGN